MRKIDYQVLARIIRAEIETPIIIGAEMPESKIIHAERIKCASRIARDFASIASVDRTAFLAACGIVD